MKKSFIIALFATLSLATTVSLAGSANCAHIKKGHCDAHCPCPAHQHCYGGECYEKPAAGVKG